MRTALLTSFILFAIVHLSGCVVSNETVVNNSMPYDMQQLIKTIKDTDIAYEYIDNTAGDKVSIKYFDSGMGKFSLTTNLNTPLSSMMKELMETKFQRINPNSPNKVSIRLVDVSPSDYLLNLEVESIIILDGKEKKKSQAYSSGVTGANGNDQQGAAKQIHELLLKFVIATDKFIDTQFDVQ